MSFTVMFQNKEETKDFKEGLTIQDVLDDLDLSSETVVAKQNGDIVVEDTEIQDGDEIKLIQIIYGG
ncbi:MAG: sulfur carrier protein ThiS [Methanobrevibacter sp.]